MIRVTPGAPEDVAPGYVRRTAHIDSAAGIEDIWFMTPAAANPVADDWLLPIGMLVGMTLAEDVHIAGRVSRRLLASMDEIQRITAMRHDVLTRVRITADAVAPTPRAGQPRVVACFSGGVDAFYTALDPGVRADELLYVHGFDANVNDERLLANVIPHIRAAANELGRPLRLAESNWREVLAPLSGYPYFMGAPLLFTIAYLMGSDVTRLVLPGTCDPFYELDDPSSVRSYGGLWTTEGLETVEHGHVSRFEKVRGIADSDVAMRHLRVCWGKNLPFYNCGRCIKCMRTRVHLKLAGVEGRCGTLPPRLDPGEVRRARPEKPEHRIYLDESIAEAESQGLTDLAVALRTLREGRGDRGRPQGPRAKLARWVRRVHWSYRKRLCDASLRRLNRRRGDDHLFNYLGVESPDAGT